MARLLQLVIMAALAIPTPVSAQLLDPAGRPLDGSRRVSLGVTVPFGGPANTEAKPQLELRSSASERRDVAAERDRFYFGANDPRPPEARVGLTLEAHPQLTLAGREIPASDEKLGISTLGLVAIGVVAAAVVGGLLFIDAVNDASD